MAKPLKLQRRPLELVILPEGETILDTADACEEAVAEILARSSERWTKTDLAAWLRGPYRAATRHTTRELSTTVESLRTDREVREVLVTTRAFIAAELETGWQIGLDMTFATALDRGLVVRACDATGQGGFLPGNGEALSLIHRVFSLLAADYLTRPTGPDSSTAGRDPDPVSGIRLKNTSDGPARRDTLLGHEAPKRTTMMGPGFL